MVDDLQSVPGIGPKIANALRDLGIVNVEGLAGQDPELMYERLCRIRGTYTDRCVLYVFRCAVYFATEEEHEPELLKWWNWMDKAS